MDKFLNKHRHNPDWAELTVDSFPWNMRNTMLDKAAAANATEATSDGHDPHQVGPGKACTLCAPALASIRDNLLHLLWGCMLRIVRACHPAGHVAFRGPRR